MTKPIVRIYQGDGEFIDREMNDAEFVQYEIDQINSVTEKTEAEAKAQAKVQAKAALLTQLGITEEQAKLLLS
jgi:hypothetical protein